MKFQKIMAATAVLAAFSLTLTGCGKVNSTETVATINGTEISAGLVNLKAQITAASYDTYMASYYGADMWSQELGSTEGETLADDVRRSALEEVELQYLLAEHMDEYGVALSDGDLAAIESSTAKFLADNDEKALSIMTADEDTVREMFRLTAIETRMEDAIKDTADSEVTEEELAAAQEEDENATEDTILSQRQNDLYTEITDGYKDSADITVNDSVLKKISFKKFLQIKAETDEEENSVETTESVLETEEVAGTESASGTEAVAETGSD